MVKTEVKASHLVDYLKITILPLKYIPIMIENNFSQKKEKINRKCKVEIFFKHLTNIYKVLIYL